MQGVFTQSGDQPDPRHLEKDCPCAFTDSDIASIYDENGNDAFKITFRAEIELNKDGDTAVFNFEFEVSLLDGTVVISGASTATGTRIKVEPRR